MRYRSDFVAYVASFCEDIVKICLDIVSIMAISPFSSVSSSYRKSHGFLRRVNLMAAHSAPAICARWLGNPFRRSVESAAADGNCQNL